MSDSVSLKLGKTYIKIISTAPFVKKLSTWYSFLIADEHYEEDTFTICVDFSGLPSDGETEKVISFVNDVLTVQVPNKKNYVNVYADYKNDTGIISLKSTFDLEKEWADWEFCFRLAISIFLFKKNHLIVHCAGLLHYNELYIITGESGAGKTTAARNCIKSNGVKLLNDDTMILYKDGDRYYACAAPYRSTSGICPQSGVGVLKGIYRIHKSTETGKTPMTQAEAMQQLWTHTFMVGTIMLQDERILNAVYYLISRISETTQKYHLYSTRESPHLFEIM